MTTWAAICNSFQPRLRTAFHALAGFCLLVLLQASPASGSTSFISTMIGGGYALGDRTGKNLETLQNYGMVRLAYELDYQYPFFMSFDLETLRIQRDEELLEDHHYGEGGGLAIGARSIPYAIWIHASSGRLRILDTTTADVQDKAKRYTYYSGAIGMSYSIYEREYAAVDVQGIYKLITAERDWRNTYGYKNIQLASIVLAFTLHDL